MAITDYKKAKKSDKSAFGEVLATFAAVLTAFGAVLTAFGAVIATKNVVIPFLTDLLGSWYHQPTAREHRAESSPFAE